MLKVCKVCGKESEHKSWKSTTCNDCLAKGIKWCSKCKESKPLSDFHKNGNTVRSFCKECEIERSMQSKASTSYYARPAVKAKRREDSRLCKRTKYLYDEDYRLKELNRCHDRRSHTVSDYTVEQWHDACSAFSMQCAYCGATHSLTMDHVIPVSKGGMTVVSNIIPACQSCNSSKQNKDMIQWYTDQIFYNKNRLEAILKFIRTRR